MTGWVLGTTERGGSRPPWARRTNYPCSFRLLHARWKFSRQICILMERCTINNHWLGKVLEISGRRGRNRGNCDALISDVESYGVKLLTRSRFQEYHCRGQFCSHDQGVIERFFPIVLSRRYCLPYRLTSFRMNAFHAVFLRHIFVSGSAILFLTNGRVF